MSNIVFLNNINSSLFYLNTISSVDAQNVYLSNNNLDGTTDQNAFMLTSIKVSLQFIDCHFENITTYDGLINVQNWMSDSTIGFIKIQNLYVENIYYYETNSYTGAGFYLDSKKTWNITIINATFLSCFLNDQSDYEGSAVDISINSITSSILLENSSFVNFTSTGEYGAIYLVLNSITLENCKFGYTNFYLVTNISNSNQIISKGTFLYLKGANISILSSNFAMSFGLYGGAIYITNSINKPGNITITNCNFNGIYSLSDGGAIYFTKSGEKNSHFKFSNCNFQYIFGLGSGALETNWVDFENCHFSNFDSNIGSVFYEEYSNISLVNCTFVDNFDWDIQDEIYDFFLMNSMLNFNQTTFSGTLFSCNYGLISLMNVSIQFIQTDALSPSVSKMTGVTFSCENSNFNNISFFGSGFYLTSSTLTIKSSYFTNLSNENFNATDLALSNISPTSFIYLISGSQIEMNDSHVFNVTCLSCTQGSFLYSLKSLIILSTSSFDNNFGMSAGVLYAHSNLASFIINCSFSLNEVIQDGGVAYIETTDFQINHTNFTNNSAIAGMGGAIYYTTDESDLNLWIEDNIFMNNFASVAGAIYYQNVKIQISSSTKFSNNYATDYGANLYSYPSALRIIDENKMLYFNDTFSILDFRSGGTLPNITVQLLDEENNTLSSTSDISTTLNLELIPNLLNYDKKMYVLNQTEYSLTNDGVFIISYLNLISNPDGLVYVNLTSPSIKIGQGQTFISDYNYFFSVALRNCQIGEVYMIATGTCYQCENGTYSFDPDDNACKTCITGLICDSAYPIILSGYWRISNITETILPCINLAAACIGGNSSGNEICLDGHIGARCESCDLMGTYWGTSYARSSKKACLQCDAMTYNYVLLAFVALVNFAAIAFSIVGALKNIEQSLKLKVIRLFSRFNMLKTFNNESSLYIKIYLAYFQIIQVISTFNLTFPNWSQDFVSTFGNPTESSLYSTDCVIRYFNNFMPYIYIKLFIALIVPFIYLIIFSLGYTLFISRFKMHRKYSMLYTACLFTLIYFQPTIIQNTIGVLSCITIGDYSYIQADVAYFCNTADYWFYSFVIGIPSLLLWGLVVPLGILWRLIKNRKYLQEIRIQVRYGYIYQEYKIFYWEFVKMYEKILVTLFLQFYQNDVLVKGLLILIVVVLYLIFISICKPYKTSTLTKVDQISTSVISISIFLAIFSYNNPFTYLVQISYYLLLLINLSFNVFMIVQISRTFSLKFDLIFNKLRKNKPFSFFLRKPFQTLDKWRIVRRAVAKYLREKERRKMDNDNVKEKKLNLSLEDYNPEMTGIKKRKIHKGKIFTRLTSDFNEEGSPSLERKVYQSTDTKFMIHQVHGDDPESGKSQTTRKNEEIFSEEKRISTE